MIHDGTISTGSRATCADIGSYCNSSHISLRHTHLAGRDGHVHAGREWSVTLVQSTRPLAQRLDVFEEMPRATRETRAVRVRGRRSGVSSRVGMLQSLLPEFEALARRDGQMPRPVDPRETKRRGRKARADGRQRGVRRTVEGAHSGICAGRRRLARAGRRRLQCAARGGVVDNRIGKIRFHRRLGAGQGSRGEADFTNGDAPGLEPGQEMVR